MIRYISNAGDIIHEAAVTIPDKVTMQLDACRKHCPAGWLITTVSISLWELECTIEADTQNEGSRRRIKIAGE